MKEFFAFIHVLTIWSIFCTGCAMRPVEKEPEKPVFFEPAGTLRDYSDFVENNIRNIDHLYAEEYGPYTFIADTSSGSTVVQNLIDTELAGRHLAHMRLDGSNDEEKVLTLYEYVLNTHRYVVEPNVWPTINETLQWKKGDCKGLSLLLMSLLLASGFEAHASVSNGHMWVNVKMEGAWRILELDQDPDRVRIYQIPGFYDRPLFKIHEDGTEKRLRKKK